MRLDLDATQLCGGAVQAGVDVLMAVDRAESLGEIDSLVDHDSIRYLDVIAELVETDPENRAFDWIELVKRAIGVELDLDIQRLSPAKDLRQPLVKHRLRDALVVSLLTVLREELVRIVTGDLVLIERLNEQLTRPCPGAA